MSGSTSASTAESNDRGSEKIPPTRRDEALERDGYSCVLCSAAGPEAGGTAQLEVHHADPDLDGDELHKLSNLVTLCEGCHLWHHKRPDNDDVPFRLSAADDEELDPTDYEILRYLANHGPAETSAIADALTAELSPTAVRERLAALMGLDTQVEERDRQLVDQCVETGRWGLTEQIEESKRGHIPSDNQTLIQRIEEEQVRKAMARGYDKHTVADVLDISPRTVVHKKKRAQGYQFPLDAYRRGGNGGQHPAASPASGEAGETDEGDGQSSGADGDAQQAAAGGDTLADGDEQADDAAAGDAGQRRVDAGDDGDDVVIREQLQAAITALQRINAEL